MRTYIIPIFITVLLSAYWINLTEVSPVLTPEQPQKIYTFTKQFTNTYLLEQDGRYLMIDTGLPGHRSKLLSFLKKHNILPTAIDYIILTHAHPDHAGNAAFFQEAYGTKIIAGADDLTMIQQGGYDDQLCPRSMMARIVKRTIASQRFTPFVPDILVEQTLDLAPLGWPGQLQVFTSHTKGSLVLFMGTSVFVGDLIKGKTLGQQRPDYHLFICDLAENLQDLNQIASYPALKKWYLGHMGPLDQKDVLTFIKKEL